MELTIRLFGRLADVAGRTMRLTCADDRPTIADLRRQLASDFPALGKALAAGHSRVLVDDAIVDDDFQPAPSQVVEFLPPVSGG